MLSSWKLFLSFAFIAAVAPGLMAQNDAKNGALVLQAIEIASDGNVKVTIPDDILELLFKPVEKKEETPTLHPGLNRMTGYRIQVFSDGRNQHSLEARAKARGGAILARFPKYRGQVYTFSKSPNWYTRIGNFRTPDDASKALSELKQAFPSFASEMRMVKCQITVVK